MTAALALFLRDHWRPLALVAALAVVILTLFAWREQAREEGRDEVRDDVAAEAARVERAGSVAREGAALKRETDREAIAAHVEERDRVTDAIPDRAPDDRQLARACDELRRQSAADHAVVAECRRFAAGGPPAP